MKRTALPAVLALVLGSSFAFSQQPQPQDSPDSPAATARVHAPNPQRQTMRLARELKLTPEQTARVEPILASRDQQIAALRTSSSLAPADRKKQMHEIQRSAREQLNAVLTPDQVQQFKSIQQAHRAKGQAPAPAPAV
jgi:protein CpxP